MAFTREFIRKTAKECGLDIPKEFENALVDEHLSARDIYAEAQVKDALEKNKPAEPPKIKDSDEYKALKKEFEDYKAEVSGKEAKAAKERAARAFFEGRGITGKSLDIAMRGSGAEIAALELDGRHLCRPCRQNRDPRRPDGHPARRQRRQKAEQRRYFPQRRPRPVRHGHGRAPARHRRKP